jgi:hypothetical protein
MAVYAFDVDETLEVSKGPAKLVDLVNLREHGHIVGLCGNWAMVTLRCPDWHRICSFVGPCGMEKHGFLRQLRQCGVGRTRLDARDGRSGQRDRGPGSQLCCAVIT